MKACARAIIANEPAKKRSAPEKSFPGHDLKNNVRLFEEAGFAILQAEEAFKPIRFYDVGALTWFAGIIAWEFTGFSVERCLDRLLEAEEKIRQDGEVSGTTHRFLIVGRK